MGCGPGGETPCYVCTSRPSIDWLEAVLVRDDRLSKRWRRGGFASNREGWLPRVALASGTEPVWRQADPSCRPSQPETAAEQQNNTNCRFDRTRRELHCRPSPCLSSYLQPTPLCARALHLPAPSPCSFRRHPVVAWWLARLCRPTGTAAAGNTHFRLRLCLRCTYE